jgi:hypothetical protein
MAQSGKTISAPAPTGEESSANEASKTTSKTWKPTSRNKSGASKQKRQARQNSGLGGEKLGDDRRGKGGSVMWTILLVGLCFSLVDVFYMVYLMDRREIRNGSHVTPTENAIARPGVEESSDKDPILALLRRGGIDPSQLDAETMEALPSWDEVVTLYGPKPIIHGLDECQSFQDATQKVGFVGTAGEYPTLVSTPN